MAPKAKPKPSKQTDPQDVVNDATGLSARQEAFCREYLIDFNGTQAAVRAGYAKSGAHVTASRLLSNTKVVEYLKKIQQPILDKFEITQERILQEVASLAFSNIMDFVSVDDKTGQAYVDISKCTRQQAAALEAYEITEMPPVTLVEGGEEYDRDVLKVKIKMRDKWGPLEALMKRHGLVKEVVEVETRLNDTDMGEVARRVAFMLRQSAESNK